MPKPLPPEKKETALRLWKTGTKRKSEIAQLVGVSDTVVNAWIRAEESPEWRERKRISTRESERRMAGLCACGNPKSSSRAEQCLACFKAARKAGARGQKRVPV